MENQITLSNGVIELFSARRNVIDTNVLPEWTKGMTPWRCTLSYNGRTFSFPFYKGIGHREDPPEIKEVLSCLISDARVGEMRYKDYHTEFGYDNPKDSMKIHAMCVEINKNMNHLFGEQFEEVERIVREGET